MSLRTTRMYIFNFAETSITARTSDLNVLCSAQHNTGNYLVFLYIHLGVSQIELLSEIERTCMSYM